MLVRAQNIKEYLFPKEQILDDLRAG